MDTASPLSAAKTIHTRRVEQTWTQKDLAAKLGVDSITVSRWERGATTPGDIHRVLLSRILGGHPTDYLDGEEAAA